MADRIVASVSNPHLTDDQAHLAYHQRNLSRGRMAGQLRFRVRYRSYASAWFDYLFVSPEELERLIEGTGWRLARIIAGEPIYVAVLE